MLGHVNKQFSLRKVDMEDAIKSLLELAENHLQKERYDEALEMFERILRLDASSVDALDGKARVFYYTNKLEQAVEVLEHILKKYPNILSSRYNIGLIYEEQEEHEKAIEQYDKILAAHPSAPKALIKKGKMLIMMNYHQEGFSLMEQAVEINPEVEYHAFMEKARAFKYQGDYKRAAQNYEYASGLDPENPEINLYAADCHRLSENAEKAKENYEVALIKVNKLNSDNPIVMHVKAFCYKYLEKYDEAAKCYDLLMKMDPHSIDPKIESADIFIELEQYDKASHLYDQVLSIEPDNLEALLGNARICGLQDNIEESAKWYEKCLKQDPENTVALEGLSYVLRALEQFEGALQCSEKLLELVPDHFGAHYLTAASLADLGESDEAIILLEKCLETQPDSLLALRKIGDVYHNLEEYDKALEIYQKAIGLKATPELYICKGYVLEDQKKHAESIEAFEAALALDPSYSLAKEGIKRNMPKVKSI